MRNRIYTLLEWFTLPIGQCLGIFLLMTTMICGVNIIGLYVCMSHWIPPMSLVVQLCRAILISWTLVWLWQLTKKINAVVGKIFLSLILIVSSLNTTLDVWTYSVFHLPFSSDYIPPICDTNLNEAGDFLKIYLTSDFWFCFVIAAISILVFST